ncbi:MAG: filamentous hemagglutinin N-terminal domain-containing protein [Nitrospira sp.]|nr:filamentous hemagglutinin N-terminal domain-containing protein [Nitrospira sp.]
MIPKSTSALEFLKSSVPLKRHTALANSLLAILLGVSLSGPVPSYAQPVTSITDTPGQGSLGTIVTPTGHTYSITGGARPPGGANLFHSFENFTVGVGDTALFLNTPVNGVLPLTHNILARVTSNNPSHIFGTVQTSGFGNAHLFLMNPSGIIFGPDATLNVGGSAIFTTANYIRFENNTLFNVTPNVVADALLSAAPISAFGFLSANPGEINVLGSQLMMLEGSELSLIGGNITFQRGAPTDGPTHSPKLSAPGGQINVTSVASAGEVSAIDFKANPGTTMGQLTLSQGTAISVSNNAAGTVRIRSGRLVLADATISADTRDTDGARTAVDILATGNLSISDTRGVPAITAGTTGAGNAGEVHIASIDLEATSSVPSLFSPIDTHFALIDTHTTSTGQAGPVNVKATGNLNVIGQPTGPMFFIDSGMIESESGNGGDVSIAARNIGLQYAQINTGDFVARLLSKESGGSGGNLTITADTINMSRTTLATDGYFLGRAGNITLSAQSIQVVDGSELSLLELEGGGKLTIATTRLVGDSARFELETATGQGRGVEISSDVVEFRNGTTIRSQTVGDGHAGDIRITATDHLTLEDNLTSTRATGFFTNSLGNAGLGVTGRAGSIMIDTPRLEISGGARINSTTQSSGRGGDVVITGANQITISGESPTDVIEEDLFGLGSTRASGIYSRTVGSEFCTSLCGDAGHVSIETATLRLINGATINSGTASTGNGGNITVGASKTVEISGAMTDGTSGGLFSRTVSLDPNSGKGGNIALTAGQSVSIHDGASVSASSTGPADAGNIFINAGQQLDVRDSPNAITTEAAKASGGNIDIRAIDRIRFLNSSISTSVLSADGKGGNIFIDPKVVILEGSNVTAEAVGGPGGNITFVTPLFLADSVSTVSASSERGPSGTVTIQSPTANLSGAVGQLVSKTSPPQVLLQNRCVALAGGEQSTFILTGRNTLPVEPGGWLSSPVSMEHWTGVSPEHASALMVQRRGSNAWPAMVTPKGEANVLSLRRLTPPGFLVRAFATPSTGCPS